MSTQQCTAVTYGIDLGKTWFHVVGLDPSGSPVKRAKFNRATILRFFVNVPAALVGMEACPGSMAGPQAAGLGAPSAHRASAVRQAVCEVEQE